MFKNKKQTALNRLLPYPNIGIKIKNKFFQNKIQRLEIWNGRRENLLFLSGSSLAGDKRHILI